ncbi:polysaccharide pyruvyl transferase family protein [Noviherbaspirillum sp.]|uniref:polysaccharide pyruvyl transferase family protein n=1 Tax=Noviherbaspirillum sp. TaxID=1926288 RepID=UPI002D69D387|nr:polysaccharide pyruvyl transferase family protein [Noviherbaspirillum sp.]HZW23470.1 polysaccharide pyruvyl transferase family protein [Noviherbaspirillum sp.]
MQDVIPVPTILFGAFDRHNFGDLLFPHIAAALLAPAHPVFAGLVQRDLRPCGGHRVEALADLTRRWSDCPVDIIHAGGELLTCDAWQAAVMSLPPEEVLDTVLLFDARPREAFAWAQHRLRLSALAPYTVQRPLFPHARTLIYNAVGGVDLNCSEPELRYEVLANLRAADAVGVRDTVTQAHLNAAGIDSLLMPDPAVMVAELFGDLIRRRSGEGEVARIGQAFPQGYIAVQFSVEFDDDATPSVIAAQLDTLAHSTGFGIVFFRAGAAPWHDELGGFARTAARMQTQTRVFMSLDLWDICALIAASRAYAGSSLHGRIVAMAFALPRVNLVHDAQRGKQAAFAATWEDAQVPAAVQADSIAQAALQALGVDPGVLETKARQLAGCYRDAFRALCGGRFSLGNT